MAGFAELHRKNGSVCPIEFHRRFQLAQKRVRDLKPERRGFLEIEPLRKTDSVVLHSKLHHGLDSVPKSDLKNPRPAFRKSMLQSVDDQLIEECRVSHKIDYLLRIILICLMRETDRESASAPGPYGGGMTGRHERLGGGFPDVIRGDERGLFEGGRA